MIDTLKQVSSCLTTSGIKIIGILLGLLILCILHFSFCIDHFSLIIMRVLPSL
jgi:hypothetical protein